MLQAVKLPAGIADLKTGLAMWMERHSSLIVIDKFLVQVFDLKCIYKSAFQLLEF